MKVYIRMARQKIDKNVVYLHYNIIYFDYIQYKYNELYSLSLGAHICNINLNVMSEN